MNAAKKKIAFVGQPEYFRFTYEQDLDDLFEVREFEFIKMLDGGFEELLDYQADYNFFYRGEFAPRNMLESLRGETVALSSEPFPREIDGKLEKTWDSVNRYLHFRQIRRLPYDYVFHYDAASLPFLAWDRLRLSGHFAFPVATKTYYPADRPRDSDMFFIGRSTPHRERYFTWLKHRYHFLHICHGLWGEGLVEYLRAARICLNVHAENEVSWEPRMQMMMACGAFVISERITPNPYLRPGLDFVQVDNPAQMHEAVAYYLAHPQERDQIARAGCERVHRMLSSREAFSILIAGIEAGNYPRFQSDNGAWPLDALNGFNTRLMRLKARVRGLIPKSA